MTSRPPIDRLLAPTSVAVLGASARPGSFGERLAVEALRSCGVSRVDLIHPEHREVQGRRTVPTLGDLDATPDLVLMGVPDRLVAEQLMAADALGVGGAVVFGGLAGLADDVRAARGDLALCGGGCMGFVNPTAGVRALGYLERDHLPAGPIALVTHSGSLFSALLRTHRRLEFALAVSSGQELGLSAGDYLCWALEQPETRVVGLFLETIRDAATLRRGLALALELDVPVVALTVGTSSAGRALVTAHSGAIAGADAGWEALFAAYGVHRVRDVEELVDTLELFAIGRRVRRGAGPDSGPDPGPECGIATIHDSGAERTLIADLAEAEGVPFAPLSGSTREVLAGLLDDGLVVANPVDVWGRGADTEALFADCLDAVAADKGVEVVALAVDLVEEYDGDESYPRSVVRAHAATDKPVVVLCAVPAAVDQAQAAPLRQAGIAVLEGARSGLRAMGHLRAQASRPPMPLVTPAVATGSGSRGSQQLSSGWFDAVSTLELVARYGIETVATRAAASTAEAVSAAAEVGYPVVLKTDEPGIAHRARLGGVALGIADEAALRAAYDLLCGTLGPRVVVQPQLEGEAEYALGVVTDPQLGPLIVIAHGGSGIEELATRVVSLPEALLAAPDHVARRLPELAHPGPAHPNLAYPGVPPSARAAEPLARAAAALARLALDHGDSLSALDINPLIFTGDHLIAVDALIVELGPPSR